VISFEQQERWVRARVQLSLDPADANFCSAGLFALLDGPGIAVVVLPADVLAQPVDFTDDLPGIVLPDRFRGLTANGISALSGSMTTSTALLRFAPGVPPRCNAFVALDRHGGVLSGIGTISRYQVNGGRHSPMQALHLFMLAHLIGVIIDSQARVLAWASRQSPAVDIAGPFEIVVGVPAAAQVVLGGLNEGWESPEYALDLPPRALEKNVLVRLQAEAWPADQDSLGELKVRVLNRACEAFGDRQQRFLVRQGHPGAGMMPERYA
jgi:hypothetical protein